MLSVRTKLILSFGLSILITVAVGIIGLKIITNSNAQVESLIRNEVSFLKQSKQLQSMALTHRRYEKDFFLNIGTPDKQKKYVHKFKAIAQETQEVMASMADSLNRMENVSDDVHSAIVAAIDSHKNYVQNFEELSKRILNDDSITPQEGNKMMKPFKKFIYSFATSVDLLEDVADKWIIQTGDNVIASGKQARMFIILLLPVALFLGVMLAFFLTRNILNTLGCEPEELSIITSKISNGDLVVGISAKNGKKPVGVYKDMGVMCEKLQQVFKNFKDSIELLSQSSSELLDVSSKVSSGAEESSQKTNAVAAASEEMNANMKSIAIASEETSASVDMVSSGTEEMASNITAIVGNTDKTKAKTKTAVTQSVTAADRINKLGKAANEIGKVTETITEISEQTNLLALNATIEAARAGEAGKGFAVVANEIKDLAQQTSEATTQIKDKITSIQEASGLSVADINQIANIIKEIDEMINTVAATVNEQSNATQEIASNVSRAFECIQDVNQNVSEATLVTGEIASDIASVSQISSELDGVSKQVKIRAESLSQLSTNLTDLVNQFKL